MVLQKLRSGSKSTAFPYKWTAITALVFFVNTFSRCFGLSGWDFGSISTRQAFAPEASIAATVATAVCDTVMTSSPNPTFKDLKAIIEGTKKSKY